MKRTFGAAGVALVLLCNYDRGRLVPPVAPPTPRRKLTVIFADGNDSAMAELVKPTSEITVMPLIAAAALLQRNTSGKACSMDVDTSTFASLR